MKNILFLIGFLALSLFTSSCGESEADIQLSNKEEIEKYIADNNLDAQSTSTGLYYVVEKEGNGEFPVSSSTVTVDYRGYLTNGEQFDSSYSRGMPATFNLGSVVKGWTEGIPKFSVGGKGILLIPSQLGYGNKPPAGIPENAVLIFDIELYSIQ